MVHLDVDLVILHNVVAEHGGVLRDVALSPTRTSQHLTKGIILIIPDHLTGSSRVGTGE